VTNSIINFGPWRLQKANLSWGKDQLSKNSLRHWRWLAAGGSLVFLLASRAHGGTLADLASFPSGSLPYGGLVQASDGNLYGTTEQGGTNNDGTMFRIATNGTLTTLYSFSGGSDGAGPYAALVQDRDGALYGTAIGGGSSRSGTVFRITTNGVLTPLYSFTGGNDGANPFGALLQAEDGSLYGTTSAGGGYGYGSIFRITTNGSLITLYWFSGGSDGAFPYAGLVWGNDGNLYGTAAAGGASPLASLNGGTVFQFTPTGQLTPLHSFSGFDGAYPYAPLFQASDGNLYGTTSGQPPIQGGVAPTFGSIFRINYNGAFASVYSFTNGSDGANPYAGVIEASDGNFYGTTTGVTNSSDEGTAFEITPGGTLTPLVAFNGSNGSHPYAPLVQAVDGNLYGATSSGGASDGGAVFQFTLTAPPFIITQPASQTITNRATAVLQVFAGGSGSLNYQWLKNGTNLVNGSNVSGVATSTLVITDFGSADVAAYAVVVTNPYGLTTSSNAYLSEVVVKPTLTIAHPTPNERLSNAVLTVSGKTKDKFAVASVLYQLNGTGWNVAQAANAWTNWSASVKLTPGTNILQAYALDSYGNVSLTNTVKFHYILSAPITVLTNGRGTVAPNYNGQLLAIDETYTMTARPQRGFAFTNWTGSVSKTNPKLTFVMASNLTFTANFVDVSRPVMAIISPKANAHFTNAVLTVTGKASDNVAVAAVFYQLNGAGWNLAQSSNGWTNWTAGLTLTPGTNLLQAFAVDTSHNNSLTNSIKLFYGSHSAQK